MNLDSDLRATPLRLRVSRVAESRIRAGHPWVFSDSVREANRVGKDGDLAVIYDRKDRFLAIGLFDSASPIQVRILRCGRPCAIDETWFEQRLRQAIQRREDLFDERTTGYRVINGESDAWPGLVLDRYDSTFVLKLYTLAWVRRLMLVQSVLTRVLAPDRLVLRLSRNIQAAASTQFHRRDGDVLLGSRVEAPPVFLENGLRFEADVVRGQKTGFFLDQRENRERIGRLARGRRVLNAFSFSGGFSLYAARGGATAVTDLDLSRHALESAARNFALNAAEPGVRDCRRESLQADAFEWLDSAPASAFDLVILDPPSLARRESERERALAAYRRLATGAIGRLAPGGILFSASCSAHVSADAFCGAIRQAAQSSRRPHAELEVTAHAPDHPATFPEGFYLKGIFLGF